MGAQPRQGLAQGRLAEAEQLAREALLKTESTLGPHTHEAGYARNALGDVLIAQGKLSDAENEIRAALRIYSDTLPPDHQYIASAEYQLGLALLAENKLDESAQVLESSFTRWQRAHAPRWRAARSQSALGEVLFKRGQREAAKTDLAQGYEILVQDLGVEHEETRIAKARLERLMGSHNVSKLARVSGRPCSELESLSEP